MRILTASLIAVICAEAIAICTMFYLIKSEVNNINVEVDNVADASNKLEVDIDALIKEIDELEASNKILYERVVKRQKELDEESRKLDEQDRINKLNKIKNEF